MRLISIKLNDDYLYNLSEWENSVILQLDSCYKITFVFSEGEDYVYSPVFMLTGTFTIGIDTILDEIYAKSGTFEHKYNYNKLLTSTKKEPTMRLDMKTKKHLKMFFYDNYKVTRKEFKKVIHAKELLKDIPFKEHETNKIAIELLSIIRDVRYRSKRKTVKFVAKLGGKYNVETYISTRIKTGLTSNVDDKYEYILSRLKEKIREKRDRCRYVEPTKHVYNGISSMREGLVQKNSGFFKGLQKSYKTDLIGMSKNPCNNKRYVGVEIEFITEESWGRLSNLFVGANLYRNVYIKSDSSIYVDDDLVEWDEHGDERLDGWHGVEVAVLATEDKILDVMSRVMDVLKKAGCKVNGSCGTHVHLDVRNKNKDLVFRNLVRIQKLLFKFATKDRNRNEYCKIVETDNWEDSNHDHYNSISSKHSYDKFGTIEVRILQATLDKTKLLNWIKLLMSVSEYCEAFPKVEETKHMLKLIEKCTSLDKTTLNYYKLEEAS